MGHKESLVDLINSKNYRRIAEVGVFKGKLAWKLLNHCKGIEEYYAIDPWKPYKKGAAKLSKIDVETWDKIYVDVCKIFIHHYRTLRILRMTSREAASIFTENFFDLVFIDANHSYPAVKEDVELWNPLAMKCLSGHDYRNRKHGVKRAVDEAFGNKVRELPGSIWYVMKR